MNFTKPTMLTAIQEHARQLELLVLDYMDDDLTSGVKNQVNVLVAAVNGMKGVKQKEVPPPEPIECIRVLRTSVESILRNQKIAFEEAQKETLKEFETLAADLVPEKTKESVLKDLWDFRKDIDISDLAEFVEPEEVVDWLSCEHPDYILIKCSNYSNRSKIEDFIKSEIYPFERDFESYVHI